MININSSCCITFYFSSVLSINFFSLLLSQIFFLNITCHHLYRSLLYSVHCKVQVALSVSDPFYFHLDSCCEDTDPVPVAFLIFLNYQYVLFYISWRRACALLERAAWTSSLVRQSSSSKSIRCLTPTSLNETNISYSGRFNINTTTTTFGNNYIFSFSDLPIFLL